MGCRPYSRLQAGGLLLLAQIMLLAASCSQGNAAGARPHRVCQAPSDVPAPIAGGTFLMGEDDVYAEEGPVRRTTVGPFLIDRHEVTNRQFAEFVKATGYVTVAERPVDPAQFKIPAEQIPAQMLKPGAAVFSPPKTASSRYVDWWKYVPGASWRRPNGPQGPAAKPQEPVVDLGWPDMEAYARWKHGRLPTEAEWEFAAGAGRAATNGQPGPDRANTWQGVFPAFDEGSDGFKGVSPVGCFAANAFGLYDMIGNTWEWTQDWYTPRHPDEKQKACCVPRNPRGGPADGSFAAGPGVQIPRKVLKGGSHLCAPNYCQRYRPAARYPHPVDTSTTHIGFRCAADA